MFDQERKERLFDLIMRRAPMNIEPEVLKSITGDTQLNPGWHPDARAANLKRASVLIPIVARNPEPAILLTKRTEHLAAHPGQISFPGGSCDSRDRDELETALRETSEEVGIESHQIEIIGRLESYQTVSDFAISPFVGVVEAEVELTLDANEVEEVFELPLSFLLDPKRHEIKSRVWGGRERFFYAMPYNGYYIWGATAAMLVNLYQALLIYSEAD